RDHVQRVIVVSDGEVIEAMRLCWQRAKLLIEPSAAVAVAAVLSQEFVSIEGLGRVGVILSGGNVDLDNLPWTGQSGGPCPP
ncbi:MAG: pyridoxal-phosphate dependent enzyme, partial [Gemmatimonadales bacterium]